MEKADVSFLTFFIMWARLQGWTVPILHVRICQWLETCTDPERVLMVFRGAAKSTIYAVYKAWRLYRNRSHRSLVWSADNETAGMLTADTINVLRNHPLTRGLLPSKPGAKRFWVTGAKDARNASMRAVGVSSNATGARADDIDFDDIEVPGNIETPEARLKLRQRISESTHIAVPGAQKTYIGTPHTHDSIYPERIAGGASVLKIPLFEHVKRYSDTRTKTRYQFDFPIAEDGLYVIAGIHQFAKIMVENLDYRVERGEVIFPKPPQCVIDICSTCSWPERFTRNEIEKRRKETRTLNAWDSQYLLEAKPVAEIRLDPARMIPYDVQPKVTEANGGIGMWLGNAKIAGASLRWDPASGKVNSDVSALALVLQDEGGRRYLHHVERLSGEVAEFASDGKQITGGQVLQIAQLVKKLSLPRVTVETNGIGTFAPAVLKACFKQNRVTCGVTEITSTKNKQERILESMEPLLLSRGMLWAHVDVLRGPLWAQMKDWNPAKKNQADDYLDASAGAVSDTPERIGRSSGWNPPSTQSHDWRPDTGVHEVEVEY